MLSETDRMCSVRGTFYFAGTMSILHRVGEYDRGYGEGYFCSYTLAIPLSQKAEYIYNPVVPKGWGNLVLQKIDLGGFLLSFGRISRFKPLFTFNPPSHHLISSRKISYRSCHLLPKPDSSSSTPRHLLGAAQVHQARLSRAHPPNRPSTFTTLQSNCQRRAAFPDFQHTS
jgi:hypothetical protein